MKDMVFKNKFYLATVIILSVCLTLISSITTFSTINVKSPIVNSLQNDNK